MNYNIVCCTHPMHFASTQIKTLLLGTLFHFPRGLEIWKKWPRQKKVGEAELCHIIYRFHYKHRSDFKDK